MKHPEKIAQRKRYTKFFILGALSLLMAPVVSTSILIFLSKASEAVPVGTSGGTTKETPSTLMVRAPFPVSVDPTHKIITENTQVEAYFKEHISSKGGRLNSHTSWLGRVFGKLALSNLYQNLASLTSRTLVIQSGERKGEIAEHFGKILGWNKASRQEFSERISSSTPELSDGKFFPGTYVVAKGATPADVAPLIVSRFENEVLSRYGPEIEAIVPLDDTLTIASLLEREAYDFNDMRQIAGVIWNRLFTNMNLQIDATLQYAKGSRPDQPWWPQVVPEDKYIKSPFNTYKNEGLPPSPIANPSLDAILAALNPIDTDCMYYFHDKKGDFHCSKTYEEHVALLKQYYGRGK